MFQYNEHRPDFQNELDDKPTDLFLLENDNGCRAAITNYGARLVSLEVKNHAGILTDVVLGYNSLHEYLHSSELYYGAIIGRVANRIGDGYFKIGDVAYHLDQNNGPNSLHGGQHGFHHRVWEVIKEEKNKLVLGYTSADGEEGFPGTLTVEVTYTLTADDALQIDYKAHTDQETIVNLTNHSYFNLSGDGNGDVLDHEVWIDADEITALDEHATPTGEIITVADTPFDFRTPKTLGHDMEDQHQMMIWGNGYDQNFVLKKSEGELRKVARAWSPFTGILMEVETTEPGMQLYTANYLSGKDVGKNGVYYSRHAFCFETQHFPDAPNHKNFPSINLRPEEAFTSTTVYRFASRQHN